MTDLRQPFALLGSLRRGLEAMQWSRDHGLPVSQEHVELVAMLADELAELLGSLAGGERA